ncbi:MAG TPA: hypothetical protein VIT91_21655 [Chthoniobacterales bacterium]
MKGRSFIIGVAAGIVLGVVAEWGVWKLRTPKPASNLAPLQDQVQAVAEKALPLPSLGAQTIEIPPGHADMEQRIAKIIALAQALGGTAIRGLEREDAAVVLATLPQGVSETFATLVLKWPIPEVTPVPAPLGTGETVDCEIVLKRAHD